MLRRHGDRRPRLLLHLLRVWWYRGPHHWHLLLWLRGLGIRSDLHLYSLCLPIRCWRYGDLHDMRGLTWALRDMHMEDLWLSMTGRHAHLHHLLTRRHLHLQHLLWHGCRLLLPYHLLLLHDHLLRRLIEWYPLLTHHSLLWMLVYHVLSILHNLLLW